MKLAIFAVLFVALIALASAAEDVVILTEDNFDQTNEGVWFIK
jgi:hypothetical protein